MDTIKKYLTEWVTNEYGHLLGIDTGDHMEDVDYGELKIPVDLPEGCSVCIAVVVKVPYEDWEPGEGHVPE